MLTDSTLGKIQFVKHGFFTRNGGFSDGIYASLNCGPGSGDNPEKVAHNRANAMTMLGTSASSLCTLYQCHSNKVVIVNSSSEHDKNIQADAMVTNIKDVTLGILTADCGPVLFADTENKIIGAAHAGWKGALYGILENTIAQMYEIGARHENIVAALGPCIGPDSYEVGDDFKENFLREDSESRKYFKLTAKQGQHLFDLPGYIKMRLEKLGLKSVNWIGKDTLSDEENFFSYRRNCLRSIKDYGRQLSAIAII